MINGESAFGWLKFFGVLLLFFTLGVLLFKLIQYLRGIAPAPTLAEVVDAFNPVSENNLAYKTANAMTEAVTGDPSFGGYLYSATHADPTSPEAIRAAQEAAARYRSSQEPEEMNISPFWYYAP